VLFRSGKTLRAINNKLIETWDASGVRPLPMPFQPLLMMDLLEGLEKAGMTDFLSGLAGQVSGMITEVKPAAEIMKDIVNQAVELLQGKLPVEAKVSR